MKIGDRVKFEYKLNGHGCDIWGTVITFYGSERVIVRTKAGHDWALKMKDLRILRNEK